MKGKKNVQVQATGLQTLQLLNPKNRLRARTFQYLGWTGDSLKMEPLEPLSTVAIGFSRGLPISQDLSHWLLRQASHIKVDSACAPHIKVDGVQQSTS